jgi:hypothetical protein
VVIKPAESYAYVNYSLTYLEEFCVNSTHFPDVFDVDVTSELWRRGRRIEQYCTACCGYATTATSPYWTLDQ